MVYNKKTPRNCPIKLSEKREKAETHRDYLVLKELVKFLEEENRAIRISPLADIALLIGVILIIWGMFEMFTYIGG